MKILVLNYEYPPLGGGAGVITKHISEGLVKLGHHVTVVTAWYKNLPESEEKNQLTIIRLKSKRKYIYRSSIYEMLSWARISISFLDTCLTDNTFEICFANFALPGGFVALHIKNKLNIPYAIISHGHDIPWFCKKEMFWYHVLLYKIIKKICINSELNFVQTPAMKQNIDAFLGNEYNRKNVIIPNGCDTSIFYPSTGEKSTDFTLIFAGRLVKQKDPFTFLNALKLLLNTNIPFKVKIVGDGILRKSMERFIDENKLKNHVVFTGWMLKQEIADEYRSASLMVQCSIHEAMSVSVMEAMACGTYVLCTPTGMNEDLVVPGLTGEIFAMRQPKDLAGKIIAFYYDKFLHGSGVSEDHTAQFLARYRWENIVPAYDKYFKSVLNLK